MNANEKIIIKSIAARLDEVRRLAGFLFYETEEKVVEVLKNEGMEIATIQNFAYMSKALVKLADESPTALLPGTGELLAETLRTRLTSNANGSRPS